jgi:hypothetical protein
MEVSVASLVYNNDRLYLIAWKKYSIYVFVYSSIYFSHTPTNTDVNKLPNIERTLIKLDRLIGKGAFG